MSFRTIEQKIAAAAQFTGVAPGGALTFGNDMERYAVGAGGLFDFELTNPAELRQISIALGGQASWSLVLVDVDATEVPILSGTTETSVFNSTLRPILLAGQKLKLVTAGASTAMVARMTIDTKP